MKLLKLFNKIHTTLLLVFVMSSVLLLCAEILNLISLGLDGDNAQLALTLSKILSGAVPYVFCYFICLAKLRGRKGVKAFWCLICLAAALSCAQLFGSTSLSLIITAVVSLLCIYCFDRLGAVLSGVMCLVLSVLIGTVFGYLGDYFDNFIMRISELISGKGMLSGALFGGGDFLLTLFDIDSLRETFFHKSYGGSLLFNGELVTGVKDLFSEGYEGKQVSLYLSGHYYMLFAVCGIGAALAAQLSGGRRSALIITAVCAVLSGNVYIFLLFIFFESPFLFLAAAALNVLSYITAYALDIGCGYIFNGSVFEMLINLNRGVYLFAGGVVFIAIGFFVTKFVTEKHSLSDCFNTYIPQRLRELVENLGGVNNIIGFRNGALEVRNPKLVNTLKLECTVEENAVKSDDVLFGELQDYL